jgi:hypothetical protein
MAKRRWSGKIIAVQPRIRLLRSFDQRSHTYLGYGLVIDGVIGNEVRQFSIGVGQAAHQKHQFKVGDGVCGESLPVANTRQEPVEFYQTSKLKVLSRSPADPGSAPPWHLIFTYK